jgi:hypothetical protein
LYEKMGVSSRARFCGRGGAVFIFQPGKKCRAASRRNAFKQLSGSETEIHSAGPDKIMWTADDLVAR